MCAVLAGGERLTVDEILERVMAIQPLATKNPKQTVRSALTYDHAFASSGDGRYV